MAIPLQADYSAEQLRSAAKGSKDAAQAKWPRRLQGRGLSHPW